VNATAGASESTSSPEVPQPLTVSEEPQLTTPTPAPNSGTPTALIGFLSIITLLYVFKSNNSSESDKPFATKNPENLLNGGSEQKSTALFGRPRSAQGEQLHYQPLSVQESSYEKATEMTPVDAPSAPRYRGSEGLIAVNDDEIEID